MTWHESQAETDAETLAMLPRFMKARVLPEPVMWKPRPPHIPEPVVVRRPIRSKP